ncbi:MAG: hypothetical protein BWY42_01162 [Candidatus Omnitrophica bacterium ADurb.Bin277]|nr:MAG: hypothetical protein BWY42_01162 [Candidatus Omnitrophica bacterium ADurb.Bin277]
MKTITDRLRTYQRGFLDSLVGCCFRGSLEKRAELITCFFEKALSPGSRVLDLGGGWGFYSRPLARRGHESVILDVIRPGYQKAPVVLYEGERIPFDDESFDAAILITMLHHVPDPEKLLREVRRVTRGKVVVVEDLFHHGLGRFWTICRDRLLNMEFMSHPHQFRKHEEWVRSFERQGFKLVRFEKFYTWLAGLRILNGLYVLE